MKVTIKEIAQELGIAPATASRALNDHPEISESTKKRVNTAAKEMGYRANKIASSLRSGKTKIIGVLIPNAEHWFFGSVINGISNIASLNGYSLLIYHSNETEEFEKKGIETFIEARVDGIIVSLSKGTRDFSHFEYAKNLKIPIVFFDRIYDNLQFSSVTIDDYMGGFMATEALINAGYKKIAHTAGLQHIKAYSERLKGYLSALKRYKMKIDERFIFHGDGSVKCGQDSVYYFMQLDEKPDAIFGVEDFTVLGALRVLRKIDIKVPEEFGLIGFCKDPFGEYLTPSLSTVDQKTIQMGEEAFNLLYDSINNKSENAAIQRRILMPELILRESSHRTKT